MSDLKERVRKEYGKEIKELITGVMFVATIMNEVDNEYGFAFIDLIIEELEKLANRKPKSKECEKDEISLTPDFEELRVVKTYKIADFDIKKDAENVFVADEKFLKEQLAKAVMDRMSIERTWDCLGNFKISASIFVQKKLRPRSGETKNEY